MLFKKTRLLFTGFAITAIAVAFTFKTPDVPKPDADNAGLKLPEGFGAIKAADNLGQARHLVVMPNGDLVIKVDKLKDGKGILWLKDTDKDGKVDKQSGFGDYRGTGIYKKGNYLYASSNSDVYRYKLDANGQVTDQDNPEKIITGLINRRMHESKSIVVDDADNIYVNIGAFSNACGSKEDSKKGMQPCPVLDSAAAIWQFKADKPNQTYSDGVKFAGGLRNVVGLDWNTKQNSLYVTQHGRDALHDLFPQYYSVQQSAELPSECLYKLKEGDNAGWPYMYYDNQQKKKILAPEYGGNGKKPADSKFIDPAVAFPGHMAPDGLLFYTGNQFPARYKNGAFIAFHGSWNRAPEPQKGYFVVFQPFKDGKPSGKWEVFADGFSGLKEVKSPGDAEHRPCGLAQGPDGSLYVSDDVKGTIYRIMYTKKG